MAEGQYIDEHIWDYIATFHADEIASIRSAFSVQLVTEDAAPGVVMVSQHGVAGISDTSSAHQALSDLSQAVLQRVESEILTLPRTVNDDDISLAKQVQKQHENLLIRGGSEPETLVFIGSRDDVKVAKTQVRRHLNLRPRRSTVEKSLALQREKRDVVAALQTGDVAALRGGETAKMADGESVDDDRPADTHTHGRLQLGPEQEAPADISEPVLIETLLALAATNTRAELLIDELLDGRKSRQQVADDIRHMQAKNARQSQGRVPRQADDILPQRSRPSRFGELMFGRLESGRRKDDKDNDDDEMSELFAEELAILNHHHVEDEVDDDVVARPARVKKAAGQWRSHDDWMDAVMQLPEQHAGVKTSKPRVEDRVRNAEGNRRDRRMEKSRSEDDFVSEEVLYEKMKVGRNDERKAKSASQVYMETREDVFASDHPHIDRRKHAAKAKQTDILDPLPKTFIEMLDFHGLMQALQDERISETDFELELQRRENENIQDIDYETSESQAEMENRDHSEATFAVESLTEEAYVANQPADKAQKSVDETSDSRRQSAQIERRKEELSQIEGKKEESSSVGYKEGFGAQPDSGTLDIVTEKRSLPGFEGVATIRMDFHFPKGKHKATDPRPGCIYTAVTHTVVVPATSEGQRLRDLLKMAFNQKVLFHIARDLRKSAYEGIEFHNVSQIHREDYPDNVCLEDSIDEVMALLQAHTT